MKMFKVTIIALGLTATTYAAESVNMADLESGNSIGTIEISQSEYGVVFTPDLEGLPQGAHGFHIHTTPSCESVERNGQTVLGGAAGGHFDPSQAGQHGYPWTNDNHLGDLPTLNVDADGMASLPVLAPRLKLEDLSGRAIMIHAGGDNHSDDPAPLGGGGARIACGVIE